MVLFRIVYKGLGPWLRYIYELGLCLSVFQLYPCLRVLIRVLFLDLCWLFVLLQGLPVGKTPKIVLLLLRVLLSKSKLCKLLISTGLLWIFLDRAFADVLLVFQIGLFNAFGFSIFNPGAL